MHHLSRRIPSTFKIPRGISRWGLSAATALFLAILTSCPKSAKAGELKTFSPPGYYVFHTDESRTMLQQIWLRMNFVAAAYQRRLHSIFGGQVTQKLPFYIFRHGSDYYRAGGMPGSAGVFLVDGRGQRLMAIGGTHISHQMWHVIQHEGFHQFTFAFLHRFLPPWANEGVAEYFGEGLFTGNSFVTGWIPPWRLARLKAEIRGHKLLSIHAMRTMSYRHWNDVLMGVNYDQAWSMIYFLAWADHHRFAKPFTRYLKLFRNGVPAEQAWDRVFGKNDAAFEKLWRKYWLSLPRNPTAILYAKVQTQTLENFLARATLQKQKFPTANQFFNCIKTGKLKGFAIPNPLWLPPSLEKAAARRAPQLGRWKLVGKLPELICAMPDGTRIIGHCRLGRKRIRKVWVTVLQGHAKKSRSITAGDAFTHEEKMAAIDPDLDTIAQ